MRRSARASLAIAVAKEAAGLMRGKPKIARFKKSAADLQTDLDVAVERLVLDRIRRAYPGERIISEEESDGATHTYDTPTWIVDPIDGTTNFFHGLPLYACNIAYWDGAGVRVAVTIDVPRRRVYWAERGRGAWMGRHRLRVAGSDDLAEVVLTIDLPDGSRAGDDERVDALRSLLSRTRALRLVGCAGLEMTWVAAGLTHAYWDRDNAVWDWAAGALLIREAGGRVTDHDGQDWRPASKSVLASNGRVHDALLELLPAATAAAPDKGAP